MTISFDTAVCISDGFVSVYGELWGANTARKVAEGLSVAAKIFPSQKTQARQCGRVKVQVGPERISVWMVGGAEIYGGAKWASLMSEALTVAFESLMVSVNGEKD